MNIFNITEFGAVGDGRTLNTLAFRKAAEACRYAGEGIVRVPAGNFLTGTFELFSKTTLLVEKGGRILASPDLKDHLVGETSVGLLYAKDAHDILLTGEGILDGNAPAFFDAGILHGTDDFSRYDTWQKRNGLSYGTSEPVHGPFRSQGRPGNMIIFARCRNVRVEYLTFTGAAYWTLHCADCNGVSIHYLRIENDLCHPNNDGIHITSCRQVRIRSCQISCGDDAIAITGFREAAGEAQIAFGLSGIEGVCEDIEISDCMLRSRSAAVRIGYGQNPVRKVKLRRLDIRESNRGIGIFARQADVEDVVIKDCRIQTSLFHGNWWGRGEPIHLSAVRFSGEPRLFHIRRVTLRNIRTIGENATVLFAEEPGAIDDVKIMGMVALLRRGKLFEHWGGNLDFRPAADPKIEMMPGGMTPFWAVGVSQLQCEGCEWKLEEGAGSPFSEQPVIQESMEIL